MLRTALLLALLAATPGLLAAEEPRPDEVTACAFRNVPAPDSIRAMRITSTDREGNETNIVVRTFGRRGPEGQRQLLLRFREPEDVKGAALLILEREGENEVYFLSRELDHPKRITGMGRAASLFGTDFSFEDFEHMEGFAQAGSARLLEDDMIGDRAVYVVESRPADSGYERVVSFVDKRTCVPLKMRFYEPGGRLRKELTSNPDWIQKKGSAWIAHMTLMEDLRDFTTTQLLIDSSEEDVDLPDELFAVEQIQVESP